MKTSREGRLSDDEPKQEGAPTEEELSYLPEADEARLKRDLSKYAVDLERQKGEPGNTQLYRYYDGMVKAIEAELERRKGQGEK